MVLASISGLFAGKVRIADPNPPSSYRLIVEGSGKIGFMKGEGVLTLAPSGGGASVAFEGDVQVGGTIASVGQRLVDTTSRRLIQVRSRLGRMPCRRQSKTYFSRVVWVSRRS